MKEVASRSFLRSKIMDKVKASEDHTRKHDDDLQTNYSAQFPPLPSLNITDFEGHPIKMPLETAHAAINSTHELEDEQEPDTGGVEDEQDPDIIEDKPNSTHGTVLYGDDPMEAVSVINTNVTAESGDDDDDLEDEEDPEEIDEDPATNSTDEFAYEKAHDDGTVLYGTNPLEAADEDDVEQEFIDEPEVSDNSTAKALGTYADEHDEEHDDGTVLYGTNPLEDEEESVEDPIDEKDPYGHLKLLAHDDADTNSTDEWAYEKEHDDGTVLYGINPLAGESEEYDEEVDDGYDETSSHDDEDISAREEDDEEATDDEGVLYGTNPMEDKVNNARNVTDEDDTMYLRSAEDDFDYSEEHHEEEPENSEELDGSNPLDQPDADDSEQEE